MTVREIGFNLWSYANENCRGKYFADRVILVADSAVVPWVFLVWAYFKQSFIGVNMFHVAKMFYFKMLATWSSIPLGD